MPAIQLPKDFLDNLQYDSPQMAVATTTTTPTASVEVGLSDATIMVVFTTSDLNAAAYHLVESMKSPSAPNAIATVLVQESVAEEFVAKVQTKLPTTLPADVSTHAGYAQVLASVGAAKTAAHALIFDVTHEQLGATKTGLITVHYFRTAKEAIALATKETLMSFVNATIWLENHAAAYELVAALPCRNYFLNCRQVALTPLNAYIAEKSAFVALDKSYHYETFAVAGVQKSVVFPIGTIFAN